MKLFTKSAFKVALECPAALYYYRHPELYANRDAGDDFLEALAEGGFQVGALAKVCFGVTPECDLGNLAGYDEPVRRTRDLLAQDRVTIAEAAFRFGGFFVRADLLRKDGNRIEVTEVKAKSWGGPDDFFWKRAKNGEETNALKRDIVPYVYDIAFQKYVIANALGEMFPGQPIELRAGLMMADKSACADIDGVNQRFKIVRKGDKTEVRVVGPADDLRSAAPLLVAPDEVDGICDEIIAGSTGEQPDYFGKRTFVEFVTAACAAYASDTRFDEGVQLRPTCFSCPFRVTDPASALSDGYVECWCAKGGVSADDLATLPRVEDLNGAFIAPKRRTWIAAGQYFLKDLSTTDIGTTERKSPGLTYLERDLVHTALSTGRDWMLPDDLLKNVADGVYFDAEGLRAEMASWTWPLHMIDFETSAAALPFYKGLRPYEQVAFQFSHHVIARAGDGYRIRHAGQYINTGKGVFPNFEFVRKLKAELEADGGSVFRYATHENTILNCIRKQLRASDEPDRDALIAFIGTLTHPGEKDPEDGRPHEVHGARDMIDLCRTVKRYFWHPRMKGSNSIKAVLPAILNASPLLKAKYSTSVYGRDIPSLNIPASEGKAWISFAADGEVENPYKKLPPVASFFPAGAEAEVASSETTVTGDEQINNGGAALWAYALLQFSEGADAEALTTALLHYCELDTLAMVFLWEYFNEKTVS
jgi:hypothetical protein